MDQQYGRGDPYGAPAVGNQGMARDEDEIDVRLSQNQARLLFLLSLYSGPAERAEDSERWIKDVSLNVLIYEAVVKQVLDYDYAPASVMVNGRRMYFNVSQEGKSDLDFLREEELVNGLKISSTAHLPITLYQVSLKGIRALDAVDEFDRNAVYNVALSPARDLLEVVTTPDGDFELVARGEGGAGSKYVQPSTVLSIEEVSYCSSAYIPACMRQGGRPTLSNAHRVEEVTRAQATSIRDDLEEVLSLNSVSVIVAEWIPFGPSQMVELNITLGSPERVLGGFFTAAVRDVGAASSFQMDPGLTAVQILDYSLAGHVNLEADIRLPEPEGIVQIETFGVSLHASGSAMFGLQLEAVMDRVKDAISLDHLSRLLVDVQTDSSEIVEPLLSPAQRRMLDLAYRGDSANRNKVNLIIANEITPHLTAEEYLDRDVYENELRQVIGDTRAAYDVTDQDTLVFGAEGLLLAGPNSRTYEPLLTAYAQLLSIDLFSQNVFSVIHVVRDDIRATAAQCRAARRDPLALREAAGRLPSLHRTVIQLSKIIAFMEESLLGMELPEAPMTAAGRSLYDRLACPEMQSDMARRVTDLSKYITELKDELVVLDSLSSHIFHEADRDTARSQATQTDQLVRSTRDPRVTRAAQAVENLQYLIIALVVYATLDRLVGTWSVADTDWFRDIHNALFLRGASAWLWISLLLAGGAVGLTWWLFKGWWKREEEDTVLVSLEMHRRINIDRLNQLLSKRQLLHSEWAVGPEGDRVVVSWVEPADASEMWNGVSPVIHFEYSAHLSRLIRLDIEYQRGKTKDAARRVSESELHDFVTQLLDSSGVFRPEKAPVHLTMIPTKDAARGASVRPLAGTYGAEEDDVDEPVGVAPGAAAASRQRQLAKMGEGGGGGDQPIEPGAINVSMPPQQDQYRQQPPPQHQRYDEEYDDDEGQPHFQEEEDQVVSSSGMPSNMADMLPSERAAGAVPQSPQDGDFDDLQDADETKYDEDQ